MGYAYSLPERELEALVEMARVSVKENRDIDRADHAALDNYHKMRRKTNEEDELDSLFTQYAMALSFFERWQKRGVHKASDITSALNAYSDAQQEKLNWLREQIEMRTIGLGWSDVKTPWSSSTDVDIGTVDQLQSHLVQVLNRQADLKAKGQLPSQEGSPEEHCPAPLLQRKTFKALGTPTVQVDALCRTKVELSADELLHAAIRRRKELEEAGEIDWVSDRQPYPTGKGPTPDAQLLGRTLEVRWRYYHKVTHEPIYIWCEGKVVQVS